MDSNRGIAAVMTDYSGHRFGKWTVIRFDRMTGPRNYNWICKCDCGTERSVTIGRMQSGKSQSCGCKWRDSTDYTGFKFDFWTVVRHDIGYRWICRCICGITKSQLIGNLKTGQTKSCGCGAHRVRSTIHGMTSRKGRTPTYSSWSSMKDRCLNSESPVYHYYGGRGIKVCQFLQQSILNFIGTVGERPSLSMTIDRKENNGHYSCGGCSECSVNGWDMNIQWSTWHEQSRNRRSNVIIFIDGEPRIAGDVAKELGIDPSGFYKRIKRKRAMA